MTKKERVIEAIHGGKVDAVPCGFSLHFPPACNSGDAGVQAHLNFFKESDCDISKIMNENLVPSPGRNDFPAAYASVPAITKESEIIANQVDFSKKIIEGSSKDSFMLGTLHGICASALHPIEKSGGYDYNKAREIQTFCLREDKKTTLAAFERITEGMIALVKGYKEIGIDGIYYAALGGEERYLTKSEFINYIKPFDLAIMKAIKDAGLYCFLHICKDGLDMTRYEGYSEYADVVNWGVYEVPFSLEEGKKLFPDCCIMGGLKNRSGCLVDGTDEEIRNEVHSVISSFGREGLIIGADCTLATEQDMRRLQVAVEACRD